MGFPISLDDLQGSHLTAKLEKDVEAIIKKPVRLLIGPNLEYQSEGYTFLMQLREPRFLTYSSFPDKRFPVYDSVGQFQLSTLNGTEAVAVSNYSWVSDKYQGLGLGTLFHEYRLNVLTFFKGTYSHRPFFDMILCTASRTNEKQIKILEKFGWQRLLLGRKGHSDLWGKLLWEE